MHCTRDHLSQNAAPIYRQVRAKRRKTVQTELRQIVLIFLKRDLLCLFFDKLTNISFVRVRDKE